jgi:hypothetical protein
MRSAGHPVSVSLSFSLSPLGLKLYTHHLIIIIQSVYCSVLLHAWRARRHNGGRSRLAELRNAKHDDISPEKKNPKKEINKK